MEKRNRINNIMEEKKNVEKKMKKERVDGNINNDNSKKTKKEKNKGYKQEQEKI